MAVEIERFFGRWRVNLVQSIDEVDPGNGLSVGDLIIIDAIPGSRDRARVQVNDLNVTGNLEEAGLMVDLVSPAFGPAALQISVYQQGEPGDPGFFRALYGTAIEKEPRNVGVWGAEEDEPPPL